MDRKKKSTPPRQGRTGAAWDFAPRFNPRARSMGDGPFPAAQEKRFSSANCWFFVGTLLKT